MRMAVSLSNILLFPCFSAKVSFSRGCRLMLPRSYGATLSLCTMTGILVPLISGCHSQLQHYSQEPKFTQSPQKDSGLSGSEITVLRLQEKLLLEWLQQKGCLEYDNLSSGETPDSKSKGSTRSAIELSHSHSLLLGKHLGLMPLTSALNGADD